MSTRVHQHQWGGWAGQATGRIGGWTEEVHRMDELIKQAREQATGDIAIDVGPMPRMPEGGEEVKYLGYLPHSG